MPASWADHSELPIVLLDPSQWEAVSYRWRSPAWQHNEFPDAHWPTWAVRAFPASEGGLHWKPLLEVAASEGFWRLGNDFVRKLGFADDVPSMSRAVGGDDAAAASAELFSVCLASVRSILGVGEREAVSILKSRVVAMDSSDTDCWDQILEADGCMSVFDKEEAEQFKKQKERSLSNRDSFRLFLRDWQAANAKVAAAEEGGPTKKRAAKGSKGGVSKYPPFPTTGSEISQKDAASMLPPGASIWRGLSNGTWQVHMAPWKRRSYPWHVFGFNGAAKECLRHVRFLYLSEQDQPMSDCPVSGLFEGVSSSSSSSQAQPAVRRRAAKAK